MKKLLLILQIVPLFVFSQGWEKTYENGYGNSVHQTTDGGYIVNGTIETITSAFDIYLIKTDQNGDTIWTQTYGGENMDQGYEVQQTIDGGYIITGYTTINNNPGYRSYVYLVKTDQNGDTLWTKTYTGEDSSHGYSIQQTTDGGYIITGYTNNYNTFWDVLLIKTNENGDTLWTKKYGGDGNEVGKSVQQTTDGGYIITGYTDSDTYNDYWDLFLIKTNENGDTLWTRTYGENTNSKGFAVQQTTDGGYIVTGSISNNTENDIYLLKTNEVGEYLWSKTYGWQYDDWGYSVQQDLDEGYIVTGCSQMFESGYDICLIKTNENGDTLWTKTYGGLYEDCGNSVQQTTDGGYIITGYISSSIDEYVSLIKTDSYGNIVSTSEIPNPNPNRKLIKMINFSGEEIKKPLNKVPYIEIYNDGSTHKKFK